MKFSKYSFLPYIIILVLLKFHYFQSIEDLIQPKCDGQSINYSIVADLKSYLRNDKNIDGRDVYSSINDLKNKKVGVLQGMAYNSSDFENVIIYDKYDTIIKDLRKQVDFLKDDLSKSNDDQIKIQDYYLNKKISNENKIDNLTQLLEKLMNEKENLSQSANENKRLNDKLMEEKRMILDKFNFLSISLKNDNLKNKKKKKRFDLPPNKEGVITSDKLKNENFDLNQLIDKFIEMVDILFKLMNDLNELFNHPKINIGSVGVLIEDINLLKKDILNCFEVKEKENYNNNKLEEKKKWKEMKTKLYNSDKPYIYI